MLLSCRAGNRLRRPLSCARHFGDFADPQSAVGIIPTERWLGAAGLVLALGSMTAGPLASTLHLGHPERAWRAISQRQSSWLSREGLLALMTYIPTLMLAASWVIDENVAGLYAFMTFVVALGAMATVYCTGMIDASLPPIHALHQPLQRRSIWRSL